MEKKDMTAVIVRCLNGDRQAQEELVLATQKRVYYHAKKLLKNEDQALDVTQDVLIAMLTKLDTLQKPEFFWTWLGGITSNLSNNVLRASKRKVQEVQFLEDEDGNSAQETYETLDEQTIPDKVIDNDETRRMIVELVDDLPDTQRQCVLLYYYDEMSVKDIAAALGASENTIKSRLNYARKSIKEGVERYEKQGIKLYGMSPLPFLLFFLGRDAEMCGMTTEQAKQMVMQVMQKASITAAGTGVAATAANAAAGGSAAGTASGGTIATSTKAATAAAGKGLFGLSTKAVAGALAGLVLAGGIVGGIVLGGERLDNSTPVDSHQISVNADQQTSVNTQQVAPDDGHVSMAYVGFPEWVNVPYDQAGSFFGEDCKASVREDTLSDGSSYRECYYVKQDGTVLLTTQAATGNDRITMARNYLSGHSSQPIGWKDISMGESYESVMAKLGLEEISSDLNFVQCYCYESDPAESEYYARADAMLENTVVLFYYTTKNSDCWGSFDFKFENGQLVNFIYHWRLADSSNASSKAESTAVQSDHGTLNESAGPATEVSQENSAVPEVQIDGPDAIRLAVDGTYVERELEICGQDAMSEVFWETNINGYLSVAPGSSFTVTNVGADENAYINIWVSEYTKSNESKIIIATDDSSPEGASYEVDVMGRYYTRGKGLYLTEEADGRPAGEGLNWWTDINGIVLWNDWDPMVRLYPGQSVTFRLPENETEALYDLVLGYVDPDDTDAWIIPSKQISVLIQQN